MTKYQEREAALTAMQADDPRPAFVEGWDAALQRLEVLIATTASSDWFTRENVLRVIQRRDLLFDCFDGGRVAAFFDRLHAFVFEHGAGGVPAMEEGNAGKSGFHGIGINGECSKFNVQC